MGAHGLLFFVVERTGLAEDGVGNGHFADVVEEGSASHDREVAKGNGNRLGDGYGESRDALAMALGFGVFQVECAAESFEGVVVGLLQFNVFLTQVSGGLRSEERRVGK